MFRSDTSLDQLNAMSANTAIAALGIVFTEIGPDFLRATMPVDSRTHQPFGLLHGGASALLAETLGSSAGGLSAPDGHGVVGIEINANHLRGVRAGIVTGTARPLHVGRSTQVWDIRVEDAAGKLVCISRLTLAVVPKP
jgi:1,4-dihydroxy-2-naphthoyl-CoA hydrolase